MKENTKRALKYTAVIFVAIIMILVGIVSGYVAYLSTNYYRIKDMTVCEVNNSQSQKISLGEEYNYSISTYNIGFGAYSKDFDFFMDSGTMLDGKKVAGSHSTAFSKDVVNTNTTGAVNLIKQLNTDFSFFQEVDTSSTRSYFVNQYEQIHTTLNETSNAYSYSFANNMHSAYLCYPFNDPIGVINSGIVTLSKYNITSATRRSFPVDNSFINKFFDLDRCFEVNILPIEGSTKNLVLINQHMSAYDKGGVIRSQQLEMLFGFMSAQYNLGNFVIAGGDWNHDIAESINTFTTQQEVPEWVYQIKAEDLPEGFSFATSKNAPTCRSTDMKYTSGSNYTVVLDGFIVSDNIRINEITNIGTTIENEGNPIEVGSTTITDYSNFSYSDHNPVYMDFSLLDINAPIIDDSNFISRYYESATNPLTLTIDLKTLNIKDETTSAEDIINSAVYKLENLNDKTPEVVPSSTVSADNSTITYLLTVSGEYKFTLTLKDKYNNTITREYSFTVLPFLPESTEG